ncbi:MAG: methionyl-tRNA formyltransferase [Fusobacteria bacterium]|nr:methionyl-tRNA formyltransferase [Fusobacteriota bacterium]
MYIIFFGTGQFAVESLVKLHLSNHNILMVVTQPDSKQGRGHNYKPSPVKSKALELGLEVFQPVDVNNIDSIAKLRATNADIFIVVSYGSLLKNELLNITKYKSINLHPSLLPLYRGAAPIQRTLMNGDTITGATVIEITEKLDAGDMLEQVKLEIDDEWNYGDLSSKLSAIGSKLLLLALEKIQNNKVIKTKQSEHYTYAKKIKKDEKYLDFNFKADVVANKVRGLYPILTPTAIYNNHYLGITKVKVERELNLTGKIGEVLKIDKKKGILVKCLENGIWILGVKPEGKKEMSHLDFINGTHIKVGEKILHKEIHNVF